MEKQTEFKTNGKVIFMVFLLMILSTFVIPYIVVSNDISSSNNTTAELEAIDSLNTISGEYKNVQIITKNVEEVNGTEPLSELNIPTLIKDPLLRNSIASLELRLDTLEAEIIALNGKCNKINERVFKIESCEVTRLDSEPASYELVDEMLNDLMKERLYDKIYKTTRN